MWHIFDFLQHTSLFPPPLQVIPRNYRIHRHCFTGGWLEAQTWLTKFPNSYIGLTPIVTFRNSRGFGPREVAKYVPLDRLLLETDAPYFVPWKVMSLRCYQLDGLMQKKHNSGALTMKFWLFCIKPSNYFSSIGNRDLGAFKNMLTSF